MDFTGDMTDMPITLTVKAPNQRVADQNVECTLSWTIRKLKEHLQHVYPNKPRHHQQKLIYSGKLLEDNLTLKQILRQDDESVNHTVHLVCSASSDFIDNNQNIEKSSSPKPVQISSPSKSATVTDGLRQRGFSSPQTNSGSYTSPATVPNMYQNYPQNYMQQMYGGMPQMYGGMPQMYGGMPQMYGGMPQMYGGMPQMYGGMAQMYGGMPQMYGGMPQMYGGMPQMYGGMPQMSPPHGYTPEQYNTMMHQMYSQYMQFYGNAASMTPPPSPATPVIQDQAANRNAGNNANRPANQNIRMNAQGGIVDDDEENENRDWLDCIYMLFRFLVLISIIYFYSTVTRSAAVFIFFFLIYILQRGWVLMRRRERPVVEPPAANREDVQPVDPASERNAENNNQENSDATETGDSTEPTTEENVDAAPPPPPPSPGVLSTAWCFFTTFFSSLIPEQPVAVNQN